MLCKSLVATIVVVSISGCSAIEYAKKSISAENSDISLLRSGIDYDSKKHAKIVGDDIDSFTSIKNVLSQHGYPSASNSDIVKSGWILIGDNCKTYFDKLYRMDRDKETLLSELNTVSALTTGVLGIANASANAIALTALGFDFTQSSINTAAANVFYELGPSDVYRLVQKAMDTYKSNALTQLTNISTPSEVVSAIKSYKNICTPISISSLVKESVKVANVTIPRTNSEAIAEGIKAKVFVEPTPAVNP